jgi:hypothetical protein
VWYLRETSLLKTVNAEHGFKFAALSPVTVRASGYLKNCVWFVCFIYSRLSNFSAIRRLSPLPVTGLQI